MVSEKKVKVEKILVCVVSMMRGKVQSAHMFDTRTMYELKESSSAVIT
jgi:hypothetical protein